VHLSHPLPPLAPPPITLAAAEARAERPADPLHPVRVLLVDDDPINLEIALTMLEGCAFDIACAENGRVALDRLACEAFDIVLMDCQMPVMNGFLAAAAIRRSEECAIPLRVPKDIPVIALTANALPGDRDRCLSAGFSDYLSKPFTDTDLHRMLQQWLRARSLPAKVPALGAADPAGHQDQTRPAKQLCTQSLSTEVVEQLINLQRAGSPGLLGRLCEAYVSSVPHNLQKLREALKQQDASEVRAAAHALKSGHRHFGALKAAELFRLIELAASTDRLSQAQDLMTAAEPAVQLAMDDILYLQTMQAEEKRDASH
jgi:two-component system sensor histidine kinase/response regulator